MVACVAFIDTIEILFGGESQRGTARSGWPVGMTVRGVLSWVN